MGKLSLPVRASLSDIRLDRLVLLLALSLGPLLEENVRRVLLITKGQLGIYVTRPTSLAVLALAVAMVAIMFSGLVHAREAAAGERIASRSTPDQARERRRNVKASRRSCRKLLRPSGATTMAGERAVSGADGIVAGGAATVGREVGAAA